MVVFSLGFILQFYFWSLALQRRPGVKTCVLGICLVFLLPVIPKYSYIFLNLIDYLPFLIPILLQYLSIGHITASAKTTIPGIDLPSYNPNNGGVSPVPAGIESPRDFNLYGRIFSHTISLVKEKGDKVGVGVPGKDKAAVYDLPSPYPVLQESAALDKAQ